MTPIIALLLRESHERRRQSEVQASLSKALSVQTKAALLEQRATRFVVRENSECVTSRKRIGNAAFAYVNGGLALLGSLPAQ